MLDHVTNIFYVYVCIYIYKTCVCVCVVLRLFIASPLIKSKTIMPHKLFKPHWCKMRKYQEAKHIYFEKTRNRTHLLLIITSNPRGFIESTRVLEPIRRKGSRIHQRNNTQNFININNTEKRLQTYTI